MEPRTLLGKRTNKAFQTLEGHTLDVLLVIEALLERPSFGAFCRRWGPDSYTHLTLPTKA